MKNKLRIIPSFTNTETSSVERYLDDLSNIPLIPATDEPVLAGHIRQGDRAARDRLVCGSLRFVVSIAKKYQYAGLPLADLIAEGNIGLLNAALEFDGARGFKFISFAVWQIRQRMLDAISDHSRTVRLPQYQSDTFREVQKAAAACEQLLGRQASIGELAESCGFSEAQIRNALYHNSREVSLYAGAGEDEEEGLLGRLSSDELLPDAALVAADTYKSLYDRIAALPAREQQIINLSYGLDGGHPMLPVDIGPVMQLSTERVRQLKTAALASLRCQFSAK